MDASSSPNRWSLTVSTTDPEKAFANCSSPQLVTNPDKNESVSLIARAQNLDTCKKPGTAFTVEYKTPGADVSMHAKNHKRGTPWDEFTLYIYPFKAAARIFF
eukprot:3820245-Amphidinium_carterae.1